MTCHGHMKQQSAPMEPTTNATTTTTAKPETEKLGTDALVERIKTQDPALAEKVSDKRIAQIARQTLRALAAEIHERDEGRVTVSGLGRLNIREIEREREGETVKSKRVSLKPSKPKA